MEWRLVHIGDLESKRAAPVTAVFVDFPKNRYNFLHKKTSLISPTNYAHKVSI